MDSLLSFVVTFTGMILIILFGFFGTLTLLGAFSDKFYDKYYFDRIPALSQPALLGFSVVFWVVAFFIAFAMKITLTGV